MSRTARNTKRTAKENASRGIVGRDTAKLHGVSPCPSCTDGMCDACTNRDDVTALGLAEFTEVTKWWTMAEWTARVAVEDLTLEQREVFMASRAASEDESRLVESAKQDMELLELADECVQALFDDAGACFIVQEARTGGHVASLHFLTPHPDLSETENAAAVTSYHAPTWRETLRGALLQALKI